jgi:small subunit ribosomal protein S1
MARAKQIHKDSSKMAKLLTEENLEIKQLVGGTLVEGVVVSISHDEILLDVGAKSEGIVTGQEMTDDLQTAKNLKVGDSVLVKVLQAENDQGYIVLSLRRSAKERKWIESRKAYENGSILEATILEYNKGGLLCDCFGLRAFIPLSHLDRVHFSNDVAKFASGGDTELKETLRVLTGKVLKVKVIELDEEKNRFVLSEKDALSTYSAASREKRLEEIEINSTQSGIVTGIMPFGVFVDLDGVEGLVHISEIAWEKVSHPSKYFSVGQTIEVLVLGIDAKSKKLALSVKRLMENPWENVDTKYPIGATVKGVVSKVVPFGAFVTLEKGLDGLIHASEIDEELKDGDKVSAVVIQVDGANQKLALSTRQIG